MMKDKKITIVKEDSLSILKKLRVAMFILKKRTSTHLILMARFSLQSWHLLIKRKVEVYRKTSSGRFPKGLGKEEKAIARRKNCRLLLDSFCKVLSEADKVIDEFSPFLFISLVDKIVVYSKEDVRVLFKDGREV